jgi:hypothetical protein
MQNRRPGGAVMDVFSSSIAICQPGRNLAKFIGLIQLVPLDRLYSPVTLY